MKLPLWLGSLFYLAGWPIIWLGLKGSRRAYIIVVCNNDVLVIKNWLGYKRKWRLPGGGVHRKEDPGQAAVRELKEELGLNVDYQECKLLVSEQKATQFSYTYWVYLFQANDKPNLRPSFDTTVYKWVPLDALENHTLSEELNTALPLVKTNSILV
jgi:8-oxo-dGTP pyrophosphatase MutT (NUDIX family)